MGRAIEDSKHLEITVDINGVFKTKFLGKRHAEKRQFRSNQNMKIESLRLSLQAQNRFFKIGDVSMKYSLKTMPY
mgnify:CR=1 FL=1